MDLARYINGFERLTSSLPSVAQNYGCSKYKFIVDALWSYIRYGATPNEYIGWEFYRLSSIERKKYFTARHCNKYYPKFNPRELSHCFDNKHEANMLFSNFITRDWLYCGKAGLEEIERFIQSHDKIIVKPSNESQGKGVHIYKGESTEQLKATNSLLEDFVIQHPLISKLNNTCVNTVRVYTLKTNTLHRKDEVKRLNLQQIGNTLFLSTVIRVGGQNSEIDNYHAGGVGYPIDIISGIICGAGMDIRGNRYINHPSTNTQAVGMNIPNWEELKQFVYDMNQVVKEARMVAWDIAILENGFDLIEANYGGGPGLLQGPLRKGLKDIIIKNL